MTEWIRTNPKILLIDLLALLLGVLLTFSFAPYKMFFLTIISMVGLLILWLNVSPKRAFWLGFVFGIGLFGRGVYWIYNSIHDIGEVSVILSFIITFAMICFLSLYPATVGYFLNRYFKTPDTDSPAFVGAASLTLVAGTDTARILYAFPALWVLSEWVRSWFFTGFPWLFLGYSQTNSPLKGYASILGVYGVSLAVLLTSAFLITAFLHYQRKNFRRLTWDLLSIILIWIAGLLFTYIPWTQPVGQPIPVSLVQGNIPQILKWNTAHLQLSFDRYQELTKNLWGKNKLIVWPESAIPLPLQNVTEFIDTLDTKARETGSSLILGIPIEAKNRGGFYNAIVTLGETRSVYLKRHLVPFGEYTPFSNLLYRVFNFMDIPMSNTVQGDISQKPLMIDHIQILPSICYEIAFPDLMRSRDKDIGFILTLTNDAWFGESNAQAQHLQMAQMRAIEFRRPLIFVTNDGITAIIGSDGRIISSAPPRTTFVLNGIVQPVSGLTPWMTNGSDPVLFISICLLFAAVRAKFKKVKLVRRTSLKKV